jgi:NADH-quinone oxidoreductase subunit J
MSIPLLLFFAFSLIAVCGALALIIAKEPIHSALALIVVMIALAQLYILLGAEFISAVQVIVYAGAVMVLFVFVIMLLNAGEEERTNWSRLATYAGIPLGLILLFWLAHGMAHTPVGTAAGFAPNGTFVTPNTTTDLSNLLFRTYLLPFEVTSVLILIAILGALVLAKRDE